MQIELCVLASLYLERGSIELACLSGNKFILFVVEHKSQQGLSSSSFLFCRCHIGVIRCGSGLLNHRRFSRYLILLLRLRLRLRLHLRLCLHLFSRWILFQRTFGSVLRHDGGHYLLLLSNPVCIIGGFVRFSIMGCSLRVD